MAILPAVDVHDKLLLAALCESPQVILQMAKQQILSVKSKFVLHHRFQDVRVTSQMTSARGMLVAQVHSANHDVHRVADSRQSISDQRGHT